MSNKQTKGAKDYAFVINGMEVKTTFANAINNFALAEGDSQSKAVVLSKVMAERHGAEWALDYINKEPDNFTAIKGDMDMIKGHMKDIWAKQSGHADYKAVKDKALKRQIDRRADKALQRLRDTGKPEKQAQRRESVSFAEYIAKAATTAYNRYLNTSHDKLTEADNKRAELLEALLKLSGIRPETLQQKQK